MPSCIIAGITKTATLHADAVIRCQFDPRPSLEIEMTWKLLAVAATMASQYSRGTKISY